MDEFADGLPRIEGRASALPRSVRRTTSIASYARTAILSNIIGEATGDRIM
jgi:hypothetical protein